MENEKKVSSFRDLEVYRAAFALQRRIFQVCRDWPKVESYALIDQIRRCSRSVGANVAEAWAKRRYPAHFLSKLTDADGELQETLHWLATANDCGYLPAETYAQLTEEATRLGQRLGMMINRSDAFCFK